MATKLTIKKGQIFDGPKGKPGFQSKTAVNYEKDSLAKVNQKIKELRLDIVNHAVGYGVYDVIINMGKALNVLKQVKIDLEEIKARESE